MKYGKAGRTPPPKNNTKDPTMTIKGHTIPNRVRMTLLRSHSPGAQRRNEATTSQQGRLRMI